MEVGAGSFAGRSDVADDVALLHRVTGRNGIAAIMSIQSLSAIIVSHNHVSSVAPVPAARTGDDNFPRRRSQNRSAHRCPDINAIVSVNALSFLASHNRPQKEANDFFEPRRASWG